jgi:hypothetical protein
MDRTDVFSYITSEATNYKSKSISLGDNWMWNMYEHINRSFLMKHSKFFLGDNDLGRRPFKNIVRPILNVAYRNVGFDVKDIEPFVDDEENYHKSMLVRKFHPKWALQNKLDTAIDESVESYEDYGVTVAKYVNEIRPEIVPLQRLAFVDQRDILSGAICEKHDYSIDELLEMKKYWWNDEIDQVIALSRMEKPNSTGTGNEQANSKSIEVFELHGNFPETWLKQGEIEYPDNDKYCRQLHIVTYYKGSDDRRTGIELFAGRETKEVYKVLKRGDIYNRAAGTGGIEELFEHQVWVNYDIIQMKEMLDVASMMILNTQDPQFTARNRITNKQKGEIVYSEQPITWVNVQPVNMNYFVANLNAWEQSARTTGSASDPQLGLNPVSGTPLGTTEIVTNQGEGIHDYNRGKLAAFWEEIYRDWVIPSLVKEMNNGKTFLEELSLDELEEVSEAVMNNLANEKAKEAVLSNKPITGEELQLFKEIQKASFQKGGTKRFWEIIKGELKGLPVDVRINVAGKQKDLNRDTGKLAEVFKAIIANPQGFMEAMQMPQVAKTFNQMLEYSGMGQINFSGIKAPERPSLAQGSPLPRTPELAVS